MARDQKSEDAFKEIDENLRKAYDELVNEELPLRFKELLQRLKENSQSGVTKDSGDVE